MGLLAGLGAVLQASARPQFGRSGAPAPIKRRRCEPLDRAQSFPPLGSVGHHGSSGWIKDHPAGKAGRVGLRFNVNPTRAVYAFDGLTDSSDRFIRTIRQSRSREMVIVQRDGRVKPWVCHFIIIGELGYGKVKMACAAETSSQSSRRFISGLI
jgi:hypothetical protein